MGSIHGCAPRRGYISERGWNSPARVYVRPWGKNTSVRRDGNQFPKVVVIRPHVCARPCGKNTSVRRDGNQLPNAVGICPHVCVRPWRGWNSTARVCATAGSTYECALRWDIFPNVLGICPHVCMRPWEVYTSVRRDGNQFPNVVGIRPHVCARPWGKNTSVRRDGNRFPNVVGIRPHVCVRPWKVYAGVHRYGYRFPAVHEVAGVVKSCARALSQKGSAQSEKPKTTEDTRSSTKFQAWWTCTRMCVSDIGKYTRVCAAMGLDSQKPPKLPVWLGK